MAMVDPFSPNRFIHEVDSSTPSSSTATRSRGQPARRRTDKDEEGPPAKDTDRESTSSHPRSRAATRLNRPGIQAGASTNHSQTARVVTLDLRGIAILSGVFISLLLFCIISARNFLLSPSPTPRDLDPAIKAYIDRSVTRAMRDPVGRRDFALLADGAIILPELTKLVTPKGVAELSSNSYPEMALNDDIHVGNCWSVSGSAVQLGLRLSAMIYPTHVSIDNIPFEIAADVGRAPRSMLLWGGVDGEANQAHLRDLKQSLHTTRHRTPGRTGPKATRGYPFVLLGAFEYDIRASSHVQTFALEPDFAEAGMYFGVVVLEITSNWGANSTCLYRLRVHGDPHS